jgi:hypothetical protein
MEYESGNLDIHERDEYAGVDDLHGQIGLELLLLQTRWT